MITIDTPLTAYNSVELADQINATVERYCCVSVNGRLVSIRHDRHPARSCQNGTIEVRVQPRGKTRNGYASIFVKVGQRITVKEL